MTLIIKIPSTERTGRFLFQVVDERCKDNDCDKHKRAAVTSMWGVVLGYPVRTTGYFSAAQENMYAKTQVWFLHYNARPRSPGFAPATPGHQRQPEERGGSGAREGEVRLLAHPLAPAAAVERRSPTADPARVRVRVRVRVRFCSTSRCCSTPDAGRSRSTIMI